MHAHPLLEHIPLPGTLEDILTQNQEFEAHYEAAESQPLQPDSPEMLQQQRMADYCAQFLCFNRLSRLEDQSDGFNGSEYPQRPHLAI